MELPPLAASELEDMTFTKKTPKPKTTTHLGGFVVQPAEPQGPPAGAESDLEDGNSNNNMSKRPVLHRMWKYLKHTLTGALAGNGNFFQIDL